MNPETLFEKCSPLVLKHHLKQHPRDDRFITMFHDAKNPDQPHPEKDYHVMVKELGVVNVKCFRGMTTYNDFVFGTLEESVLNVTYKRNIEGGYVKFV